MNTKETNVVADAVVAVVAGGDALVAAVKAKKPRKPSVSAERFVEAVKAGHLASPKLTGAQVAASLGMEQLSFDQRLNQLRKEWEAGVKAGDFSGPFPFTLLDGRTLRKGTGKGVKTRNAIFAALCGVDADTDDTDETDTETDETGEVESTEADASAPAAE